FHDAGLRQVDVGPAREAVFEVPLRFAVAKEDQLVRRAHGAWIIMIASFGICLPISPSGSFAALEPSFLKFVQNNLLLFAVALVSGAMLLWPVVRRSAGGPSVSTGQDTQLTIREDALVV